MIHIGCDPGLSGCLASIHDGHLERVEELPVKAKGKGSGLIKNEIDPAELARLLRSWVNGTPRDQVLITIEQLNSRPSAGPPSPCPVCRRDTKALGSSSIYSMADTGGVIRGVVAALELPVEWVPPARWKRWYGISSDKEQARSKAIELYPEVDLHRKADHNKAEAILIARWAWKTATKEPF